MDLVDSTACPTRPCRRPCGCWPRSAKYAALGCVPLVIPGIVEDIPIPIERIPRHQGTDYAYVKALAEEAGYVFYIDPGPVPGVSTAYWGPEIRVGAPQPALNADLDGPHDNVTSLTFTFDKERKELPVVFIQEPYSKVADPDPDPRPHPAEPAARGGPAAAAQGHLPAPTPPS